MKTELREVKTYLRHWICNENGCGGSMKPDAEEKIQFLCDPPKIPHKCDTCGHKEIATESFPQLCTSE